MNSIKYGAIFDMDGLLFDTERLGMTVWADCLAEVGQVMDEPMFMQLLGISKKNATEILDRMYGGQLDVPAIFRRCDEEMVARITRDGVGIKEGALALLDYLKGRGIPTALASSSSYDHIVFLLEKYDLAKYFSVISSGDRVENSKPNPEIFLKAAAGIGIEPSLCVVFEDSEAGIEAAHRAGMFPVVVPDIKQPSEETLAKVYQKISTLHEGIEIFEALQTK